MDWDYTLSEKDYQRAISNGIKREMARQRFFDLGWDKERAVTEPVNKKIDRSHWIQVAAEHGIPRGTFNMRLQRGWSEEKAATTPKLSISVAHERRHELQRKYPIELLQKAVENGISEQTFRRRVREGWNPEIAATKPNFSRKLKKELITK